MHILFIVNPISGLGLGKELPEKIRRIPEYDSIPYDIVFTEYAGHARKLVEDARQEGKYVQSSERTWNRLPINQSIFLGTTTFSMPLCIFR